MSRLVPPNHLKSLRAFTRRSAGAEVSLVFYAGHGIEMDGVNYLVPVDARLERDVDVRFETVTVDDLLVSTTGASLRLVILDACRNISLPSKATSTRKRRWIDCDDVDRRSSVTPGTQSPSCSPDQPGILSCSSQRTLTVATFFITSVTRRTSRSISPADTVTSKRSSRSSAMPSTG